MHHWLFKAISYFFAVSVLMIGGHSAAQATASTTSSETPSTAKATKKKTPKRTAVKTSPAKNKIPKLLPNNSETAAERANRLKRECQGQVNAGACSGYTR